MHAAVALCDVRRDRQHSAVELVRHRVCPGPRAPFPSPQSPVPSPRPKSPGLTLRRPVRRTPWFNERDRPDAIGPYRTAPREPRPSARRARHRDGSPARRAPRPSVRGLTGHCVVRSQPMRLVRIDWHLRRGVKRKRHEFDGSSGSSRERARRRPQRAKVSFGTALERRCVPRQLHFIQWLVGLRTRSSVRTIRGIR